MGEFLNDVNQHLLILSSLAVLTNDKEMGRLTSVVGFTLSTLEVAVKNEKMDGLFQTLVAAMVEFHEENPDVFPDALVAELRAQHTNDKVTYEKEEIIH
jgi:hypothetical protein